MAEVVVIGAGLSGCLAGMALQRIGWQVTLVDRYAAYPDDFRAEQLVGAQLETLRRLGVLQGMARGLTLIPEAQAYTGRTSLCPEAVPHYGLSYQRMVQSLRIQRPESLPFIVGRARAVDPGPRPVVHLETGHSLAADLVVLATGLNTALARRLGIERRRLLDQPTITAGFDIFSPRCQPGDRPVLVFHRNDPRSKIDYLTVFPCRSWRGDVVLRGNLFAYLPETDPWLRYLRQTPETVLQKAFPMLREQLGDYRIGHLHCRTSELSSVVNPLRDGVVVIGDAYQTPCPAAGTGIDRLCADVERLAVHAAEWLAAGKFDAESIANFYLDPLKQQVDRKALLDAQFRRGIAAEAGLLWRAHRGKIAVRQHLERLAYEMGRLFNRPVSALSRRPELVGRTTQC